MLTLKNDDNLYVDTFKYNVGFIPKDVFLCVECLRNLSNKHTCPVCRGVKDARSHKPIPKKYMYRQNDQQAPLEFSEEIVSPKVLGNIENFKKIRKEIIEILPKELAKAYQEILDKKYEFSIQNYMYGNSLEKKRARYFLMNYTEKILGSTKKETIKKVLDLLLKEHKEISKSIDSWEVGDKYIIRDFLKSGKILHHGMILKVNKTSVLVSHINKTVNKNKLLFYIYDGHIEV